MALQCREYAVGSLAAAEVVQHCIPVNDLKQRSRQHMGAVGVCVLPQ